MAASQPAPVTVIIPARMGSERFPGKVLASETGWPLIRHVWEQARKSTAAGRVVIATDDDRVLQAAAGFGAECVLTSAEHANGTMRIAEAAGALGLDPHGIVVNVQGDEPEIEPELIDLVAEAVARGDAPMATVGSPMSGADDPADPNIVKVVTTLSAAPAARALYFSRARIPYPRAGGAPALKHIGLYAYRTSFLHQYVALAPTPLEQAEKLEQLRALEHGQPIAVVIRRVETTGIDTPEQYRAFVARWRARGN
ncbi:MAG: 3-deoxy-manno-octulosonate cytidylyltransferase [Phycisphaerales bacterium JB039]